MCELSSPPDAGTKTSGLNVLLKGIVGSHAYGLATEDSDVDRLGLFAAPTEKILGLHPPTSSVVTTKPDITYHEAGKYVSLALKCNPTITELLWLQGSDPVWNLSDSYEVATPLGAELINIRESFLSASYVRNAYLGYATQQFRRLENRGDGSFSADTRKRTAKHARHLLRLLTQGYQMYRDGHLTVRLENPELYHDFGNRIAGGDLDLARTELGGMESMFDATRSPLPEYPDEKPAEDWLLRVRKYYWEKE